jgi:hypothetical protein
MEFDSFAALKPGLFYNYFLRIFFSPGFVRVGESEIVGENLGVRINFHPSTKLIEHKRATYASKLLHLLLSNFEGQLTLLNCFICCFQTLKGNVE